MIQLSTNQTENLKAACYHAAKEVGNRTSRVNDVYLMQGYDSNNGAPGFTVATERPHRFSWLFASVRWSVSKANYVYHVNTFLQGDQVLVQDIETALEKGLADGIAEYEAYGETHGSDEQFMLEQQEAKDAQEVSE